MKFISWIRKSRLPRRLLLLLCGAATLLVFVGAITPTPQLRPVAPEALLGRVESIEEVARAINTAQDQSISDLRLEKALPASWEVICRRLSLALVGNGLSLEEYRRLEHVPEEDRISWWTDYLLADTRSSNYLSERLARAFVGTDDGQFLLYRRRRFRLWLAEQLQSNVRYDQIVRSMITSEGLWTSNPEVNFLTATFDGGNKNRADPVRLAGRTSRAFLGMRIDCLQCHNDFVGNVQLGSDETPRKGEQIDFHSLAAFYSSAAIHAPNVFAGVRNDKRKYKVTLLGSSDETEIEPNVPFLRDLLPDSGAPREKLAAWVTNSENKAFARASVNRFWALLFGKPLVDPVDDIPITGPYPAGLEILAEDFAKHDYDVKRLIRLIVATEAFQRDSRIENEATEVTSKHEESLAVFPMTPLRPEQVAASLLQACRLQMIDDNSSIVSQLERFGTVNDFTKAYGDLGEDEFVTQSVTIPQRLLLMNGKFLRERVKANPIANASSQIAMLTRDNQTAIDAAYMSVLNRLPNQVESVAFIELLSAKDISRSQAMAGVFWTLLNSTEFLWNH